MKSSPFKLFVSGQKCKRSKNFYDEVLSNIISKTIEGLITKTYLNKLRLILNELWCWEFSFCVPTIIRTVNETIEG